MKPGPEEERLRIDGDYRDAIRIMFGHRPQDDVSWESEAGERLTRTGAWRAGSQRDGEDAGDHRGRLFGGYR